MYRLATLSFCAVLFASPLTSTAETIQAKVNGMVCSYCAQGIEKKLRALPATEDVYVNLGQKMVAVQVKEGATLQFATVREVVTEAGFEVSAINTVNKTAAQIKAETKKK